MDSLSTQYSPTNLLGNNLIASWNDPNQPALIPGVTTSSPLAPDSTSNPILAAFESVPSPVTTDSTHLLASTYISIDSVLGQATGAAVDRRIQTLLDQFFTKDNYLDNLKTAFGDRLDTNVATDLAREITHGTSASDRTQLVLPVVQLLSQQQLNGAEGGFDATNNKIYISTEIAATGNVNTIASVAIEEIGHYFDTKLNTQDAAGDEGQIFENLVDGKAFTASQLAVMKAENDTTTIQINGQATQIEKAEGDNGIYTIDKNGKFIADYLSDGGYYHKQMAVFSLKGMESLTPGSAEFIKEAARRALTSSTQGYVIVNDLTDKGQFTLEAKTNITGQYQGRKTYTFDAGDKVAMMMVPNGTIGEIFANPNLDGDKRPLFSIDGANPGSFKQLAKSTNNIVAWEDLRRDRASDADFNDSVLQVKGTLGMGSDDLKISIATGVTWQDSQACKEMLSYAAAHLVVHTQAPVINIALANDTGTSNTDGITKDPTSNLKISTQCDLLNLSAQFGSSTNSLDLVNLVKSDRTLTLDRALLEQIYGSKLIDGTYDLTLSSSDDAGNKGTTDLKFTLDTTAPTKPTIVLAAATDSGNLGDDRTNFATVTLTGTADANTQLQILETLAGTNPQPVTRTVTTDASGNYQLTGVDLSFGINQFAVSATDVAGNTITTTRSIRQIAKDDAVITWNQIMLNAIAVGKTAPPVASRAMAIVETAVFDAVNNIVKKYKNVDAIVDAAPVEASAALSDIESQAAAVQAAYTVLSNLFAAQQAANDAALATSLAAITDGQAKTDGLAFGTLIANKVIASRVNDGSATKVAYTPGTNPGDWQPTAVTTNPDGTTTPTPAVLPQWGNVTTFGLPESDVLAYRPAPPPALTSGQYATEFNQVASLGAANSTTRTADQTQIAQFWADGGGTFTPPGHWNQIAQDVARDRNNSLVDNARLFAALNVAEADVAICCWDAKYTYNIWRPITAIRNADKDGNDQTSVDAAWTPLLTTPNFPAYSSGHSTFSGAAATVLTSFYGDNYIFSTTSPGLAGVTRSFTSFTQAADEAGMSRIYGGIHFMSDNTAGLVAGQKVGSYIALKLFAPVAA